MIWLSLLVFFACSFTSDAATVNDFIFPNNQTNPRKYEGSFEIGTELTVQWQSIWKNTTLVLWQSGTPQFQYLPNSREMISFTQFIWKVDLSGTNGNPKFDLNAGNAFFFGIFNSGTADLFESQFVNITGKNNIVSTPSSSAVATTSVRSAASTDPTTSTYASSAALSSTTDQPSSTSTSSSILVTPTVSSAPVSTQSSSELSVGAKAGIGIGSVVAFFSIVAAAFALGRFLRQRKSPHTHPESAVMGHSSFAPSTTTAVTSGSQQWHPLVEAHSGIQKPANRIYEI
ncbi:uncharacterized protein EAF01_000844 [Botrytis porri]|uniref:uncharacterized protein n=1 Tax=Botrytis porri TaxID=87229 RepID=UPI001901257C|nr:uncharacterized protein EAF01_000844 [Botrytis porri]KAF7914438.1 hypothetical protein EAF01_000844 [Botrytis porri]